MPINTNYCRDCHFTRDPKATFKAKIANRYHDITSRVATFVKHNPKQTKIICIAFTIGVVASVLTMALITLAFMAPPLSMSAKVLAAGAFLCFAIAVLSAYAMRFTSDMDISNKGFNDIHDLKNSPTPTKSEKPVCVVVEGDDHNGAFKNLASYRELDKKYRVIYQKVNTVKEFNNTLEKASTEKKIQLLWIAVHGDKDGFSFSPTNPIDKTNLSSLKRGFATLNTDAKVILHSCETAQTDFVEKLSKHFQEPTIVGFFEKPDSLIRIKISPHDPSNVILMSKIIRVYQNGHLTPNQTSVPL